MSWAQRRPKVRTRTVIVIVTVLHLAVAAWFAWHRPIDGDEGYYGLAARLALAGEAPYGDFFYPQAPLLPYVYAPISALVGTPQLPGLRLFSVALSALAVLVLAVGATRTHGSRPHLVLAGLLLLAISPELLTWNTVVKTYAMTGLGCAVALLAAERSGARARGRLIWALVGGLALGLAVSTRLLLAPAAAAALVWTVLQPGPHRWRLTVAWSAGTLLGAVPLMVAWIADPQRFWFNNLGYHRLRFSVLEDATLATRAGDALLILGRALATNGGLVLMLALAMWALWRQRRRLDPAAGLGLLMAAAYTLGCLLPDPVYMQYFTGVLPVLLLPAALTGLLSLPWCDRTVITAVTAAALGAVILGLAVVRHDLSTEPQWDLKHYRRVCRRIAEGTQPGQTVFAFWSGYVAGSGREPATGMENHFAVGVSERLNEAERRRYRIVGRRELARQFRRQEAAMVVLGAWMNEIDTALDDEQMVRLLGEFTEHYYFESEIDGVKLCLPVDHQPRR